MSYLIGLKKLFSQLNFFHTYTLKGLNAANSEFCCLWCILSKFQFDKIDSSIITGSEHARSINDALKMTIDENTKATLGYKHPPLTNIPFQDAVVDLLHLFLRITDKLQSLFFDTLCLSGKIIKV
jgi:hypothetical protein